MVVVHLINEVRVRDNIKITEDIKPEPFKVGSYEVTQEMIDENPDAFKTMGIEDELLSDNVYDMHPEVKRLANLILISIDHIVKR